MGIWDPVNMMGWGQGFHVVGFYLCFQVCAWWDPPILDLGSSPGVVLALLVVMGWEGRGRTLIFSDDFL